MSPQHSVFVPVVRGETRHMLPPRASWVLVSGAASVVLVMYVCLAASPGGRQNELIALRGKEKMIAELHQQLETAMKSRLEVEAEEDESLMISQQIQKAQDVAEEAAAEEMNNRDDKDLDAKADMALKVAQNIERLQNGSGKEFLEGRAKIEKNMKQPQTNEATSTNTLLKHKRVDVEAEAYKALSYQAKADMALKVAQNIERLQTGSGMKFVKGRAKNEKKSQKRGSTIRGTVPKNKRVQRDLEAEADKALKVAQTIERLQRTGKEFISAKDKSVVVRELDDTGRATSDEKHARASLQGALGGLIHNINAMPRVLTTQDNEKRVINLLKVKPWMLKLFEGATEAQERENAEENSVNTQVQRVMTTHAPTATQPKLSTLKKAQASGPGTRRPQPETDKAIHKLHLNNAQHTGTRKTHINLISTKHASHATAHAIPPMKAHETASFRPQPLRNETAAEEAAHKKLFFKKEEEKVAKVSDVAQHYISLTKDRVSSFQKFWMCCSLFFLCKSGFRLIYAVLS
jgi:hypothetical protein